MRHTLLITLILLFTVGLKAQDYAFLDKSWKRLSNNEQQVQLNPMLLKAYFTNGETVAPTQVINYLMKIDYAAAIYVDADNEPVALVFEEASEEQKAAKIKMYENFPGSDFMMNEQAPDFTLKDLEGDEFSLEAMKGEYVLLNFWFVGCKPCIMEIPELNELVEEFESKGIHFVAIGLDKADKTKDFLQNKMAFDYKLLPDGSKVARAYNVSSYPTHLLVDKTGKVIFSQQGYFPGLQHALRKRLQEVARD